MDEILIKQDGVFVKEKATNCKWLLPPSTRRLVNTYHIRTAGIQNRHPRMGSKCLHTYGRPPSRPFTRAVRCQGASAKQPPLPTGYDARWTVYKT